MCTWVCVCVCVCVHLSGGGGGNRASVTSELLGSALFFPSTVSPSGQTDFMLLEREKQGGTFNLL